MNRREFLVSGAAATAIGTALPAPGIAAPLGLAAGLGPGPANSDFLAIAQQAIPILRETVEHPLRIVQPLASPGLALRYAMQADGTAADIAGRDLNAGDSLILDFGGHRTGHLSFRVETTGRAPDSPARIRLTFGEVPTDVAEPLRPYKGQLSESWLPDDVVSIDNLPQTYFHPRRHAFRYVRIDVLGLSTKFALRLQDVAVKAVTAAQRIPPALVSGNELDRTIDTVSIATLRDCLQTVFEDGPRRDQRLWIGDLRLQALANYATFGANDVVKRCLYLFAGLPREDGLVNACIYEKPIPRSASIVLLDYAALFNVTLQEYVEATGDLATGRDLLPIVLRQLALLGRCVGNDGLFVPPPGIAQFIDWQPVLDKVTAVQGVLIMAYERTLRLARKLGLEHLADGYPATIARMRKAARNAWFDKERGLFVSGPQRQISWASQAWMVLAGVPTSRHEAATALRRVLALDPAIKPKTPYLYHYMVEAMLVADMRDEALALVRSYWGGMIHGGADTFWEVYDPEQPLSSPYGDIHINSYCHAWSCTPTYFYRARALLGVG